jgi:hypothetical protein
VSLSRAFARALRARGVRCEWLVMPSEDQFFDELAQEVQSMTPALVGRRHVVSIQLLRIALQIEAIHKIVLPALTRGTSVVVGRYWWSTWVKGVLAGVDDNSLKQMIEVERQQWQRIHSCEIVLLEACSSIPSASGESKAIACEYEKLAAREPPQCRVLAQTSERDALRRLLVEHGHASSGSEVTSPAGNARLRRPAPVSQVSPIGWTKLAPLRPTPVYDTYWRFAAERQAIFFKKFRGEPAPWTNDAIFQEYKFTNAYRASDRVSQYLIRHVIYEGDQTPDEVFFRTLLFKFFNRVDTWELLSEKVGPIAYADYRFDRYDSALTRAIESGKRIYSAAYIMPTGGVNAREGRKHRMHLHLLETMMREELPARLIDAVSMARAFELLRSYPSIGDFLAYQYVTDVNYSTLTDYSEMEFVVAGPGARDGIRKCFLDIGGLSESEVVKLVTDRQEAEFERLGLPFHDLWGRPLQLIDCQNLFCEVDKYARVAHPDILGVTGRTRIKQKYHALSDRIDYWYPPKWNLNDQVAPRKQTEFEPLFKSTMHGVTAHGDQ